MRVPKTSLISISSSSRAESLERNLGQLLWITQLVYKQKTKERGIRKTVPDNTFSTIYLSDKQWRRRLDFWQNIQRRYIPSECICQILQCSYKQSDLSCPYELLYSKHNAQQPCRLSFETIDGVGRHSIGIGLRTNSKSQVLGIYNPI